ATWDRVLTANERPHAVTLTGRYAQQRLRGAIVESPVHVEDAARRLVRRIEFGPRSTTAAHDRPMSLAARDVWTLSARLQVDAGARVEHDGSYGGAVPSARAGVRYAVDADGVTIVRAGYGSFIGSLPLSVQAFAGHPIRIDTTVDPDTGLDRVATVLRPAVDRLRFPRARAVTLQVERQLRRGLDGLVGVTDRRSTHLATLDVPAAGGAATVRSSGRGSYRELQVSA